MHKLYQYPRGTPINVRILPDGFHVAPAADDDIWKCNERFGLFPHEVFIHELPPGFLEKRGNGGVAVDCGAFIGDHTSQFVGLGFKTTAFEPFLDSFMCLCFNSPGSTNILGFVGDGRRCKVDFSYPGTNHGMRSIFEAADGEPSIRLDDMSWDRLDLLKIDVEGCEAWVIEGARQVIQKFHPVMIVESLGPALEKRGSSHSDLEARLRSLGCHLKKIGDGDYKFDWICYWD